MTKEGNVLLLTRDAEARSAIVGCFERVGISTIEVATGEEALSVAKHERPGLVVLDLDLDLVDVSGYETCYELREQLGDQLPIMFLSGKRTDPSDRVAGLLIGADDYVTKPFDPDELLARARRLRSRAPSVVEPPADSPLTARELEILTLLGSGLSQPRIATELFISAKTVGSHIQRILAKLNVHSRTEAVALAFRLGLIPSGQAETEP